MSDMLPSLSFDQDGGCAIDDIVKHLKKKKSKLGENSYLHG